MMRRLGYILNWLAMVIVAITIVTIITASYLLTAVQGANLIEKIRSML